MADTGQPWALRYPLLTDAPNGPVATQQLAEQTAAALGHAYPCVSTARPPHDAGLIIYEADLDRLQISDGSTWTPLTKGYDDTGWLDAVTVGWTPIGTWTLTSGSCLRRNGFVSVYLNMVTASAISAGDIANQNVAQAPAGYVPAAQNGAFGTGTAGGSHHSIITSAGVLILVSTAHGATAGATLSLSGVYAL